MALTPPCPKDSFDLGEQPTVCGHALTQLAIRRRNDGSSYLMSFDHEHSRSDTDDECYVSPPSAPLHRCSDLGYFCGKGGGQNMVKVVSKIPAPAPVFFKAGSPPRPVEGKRPVTFKTRDVVHQQDYHSELGSLLAVYKKKLQS